MTITQLSYFVAVAEELSITRTAARFHVSQPAVSGAVRDLEKEYNVVLFERRRNELFLTAAGRTVYRRAKQLLEHYDNFRATMSTVGDVRRQISLALAPNIAACHLSGLFSHFQKVLPDIAISAEEDYIVNMTQNLKNSFIDAALFACMDSAKVPELDYHPVSTMSLSFCASAALLDLPRRELTAEDLRNVPLVLQFRSSYLNVLVQDYFASRGIIPNIIFHANQLFTILSFMRAGIAGGFVPPEIIENEPDIISYQLSGFHSTVPIYFVTKKKGSAAAELYPAVREYFSSVQHQSRYR